MINSIGGQARVTAPTIFKFQINGENAGETTNKNTSKVKLYDKEVTRKKYMIRK